MYFVSLLLVHVPYFSPYMHRHREPCVYMARIPIHFIRDMVYYLRRASHDGRACRCFTRYDFVWGPAVFSAVCYFRHTREWEIRGNSIATLCAAGIPSTWLQIVQVSSTTNQVLWTARLSRNPDVCVHAWSSSWCFRCSFRIDPLPLSLPSTMNNE